MVSALAPNPINPRQITAERLGVLDDSLKRYGDLGGIVYNVKTGRLIGGHQRVKTLANIQPAPQIQISERLVNPDKVGTVAHGTIYANGTNYSYREVAWDEATETAAMLAANNPAGEWIKPDLGKLLEGLAPADLRLTGFDLDKVAILTRGTHQTTAIIDADPKIELAEELQRKWATAAGQRWTLGDHVLICGDSRDLAQVQGLMGGEKADLIVTDPPYGINYIGKTKKALKIKNDDPEGLQALLDEALGNALKVSRAGAVWYVTAPPGPPSLEFMRFLMANGILRQILAWVKDSMVLGRSDYHYQHELIYYGWTPGAKHLVPPDRTETSVWNIPRPKRSEQHPTMKPIELFVRAVVNSSVKGAIVYDAFVGSGTTIMACESCGRKARAMEIDPNYAAVVLQRWADATGETPKLSAEAKIDAPEPIAAQAEAV